MHLTGRSGRGRTYSTSKYAEKGKKPVCTFFLTHETFKSTFLRCFYDFAHKKSVKIFF